MTSPAHPKIVIIGAGSLFFGRKLIWAINRLEGLTGGCLALVDTDPAHLEGMAALAHKARAASGCTHEIVATSDFREALPGADFVVLSFSHRNAHFRGVDCTVSERHGIRMCSGDTIGPGGVFRALRELPRVMEIADAVAEICPQAWLINYINPSTVIGMALQRHARTRHFAMCDSLHLPFLRHNYMKLIGLDPADEADFRMVIAGVNHFTWMLEAGFRGRDVLEDIRSALESLGRDEPADADAKSLFNKRISAKLGSVFGAVPVCTAHTKEYLPYFQGYGPHADAECVPPLKIFEHEKRERITAQMWEEVDGLVKGSLPIESFFEKGSSDHATDVIQAIWNDSGRHLFVNVPNAGSVSNLPADALLELECRVGRAGPLPLPALPMPLGLRGLQMQILDTHQLTVDAFLRKDRNLLLRALAVDPIVNSLAAAEAVLADLYEAERDSLEPWLAPSGPAPAGTEPQRTVADTVHQGQTRIF
jgi:alpha-galactosidase/6-phospho-beta-glucosidase family protein